MASQQTEEEEEEGERPRYERRVRQTVQRYSPPKEEAPPAAKGGAKARERGYRREQGDSDSEVGAGWWVVESGVMEGGARRVG